MDKFLNRDVVDYDQITDDRIIIDTDFLRCFLHKKDDVYLVAIDHIMSVVTMEHCAIFFMTRDPFNFEMPPELEKVVDLLETPEGFDGTSFGLFEAGQYDTRIRNRYYDI